MLRPSSRERVAFCLYDSVFVFKFFKKTALQKWVFVLYFLRGNPFCYEIAHREVKDLQDRRDFFAGRHGADALSATLIVFSGLLLAIILLAGGGLFALPALIPALYAAFRILSRNDAARTKENAAFLGFFPALLSEIRLLFYRFRDRRSHVYFRCPCCRLTLRTERGVGERTLACPKCRTVLRLDTGDASTKRENRP